SCRARWNLRGLGAWGDYTPAACAPVGLSELLFIVFENNGTTFGFYRMFFWVRRRRIRRAAQPVARRVAVVGSGMASRVPGTMAPRLLLRWPGVLRWAARLWG